MKDTKERILSAALSLFVRRGRGNVTVRALAAEVGLSAPALYRHYRNLDDVFQAILRRMEEYDRDCADAFALPVEPRSAAPRAYRRISRRQIVEFSIAMFRHWTENPFAADFRRLLTQEQFHSPEMSALYQQYLGSGPVAYLTDLFRACRTPRPAREALRLFGVFHLLLNRYDASPRPASVKSTLKRMLSCNTPEA